LIYNHQLPSGLRLVLEPLPFVRSVSFGIWVRNGSRNENTQTNGLSHFIEHMMFKGTQRRSAKDIADTMDAVGGQINAFTAKEYTCYFTRTLDAHFDVALDVLTDMFFESKFDPADIDKERNVIHEEINMYEDTPEDLAVDLLQQHAFVNNALGMSILGPAENIKSFQRDDFIHFMQKKYTPHNMVIAIAGNIVVEEVIEKISKAFGHFEREAALLKQNPATYSPGFSFKEKDIEQVHLCMGLPGIKSGTDDTYALACINTILGGGMSSRLFQKIREERGLVYSVYSYSASYWDTGMFMVYAALNPAQLYEVLSLISQEIKGMFTNRVTKEQLAKAREQLKSSFLLSLESAGSRMNSIGRTLLMLEKVVTPDELIDKVDAVNLDRFYAVCDQIFKLEEMSLSLVGKQIEGMEIGAVKSAVLN